MFAKQKKSSVKPGVDRPFDPKVLRHAREIADSYQIILHREDGDYYGRAVEMPDVGNDGATPDECVRNTIDILTTAVAYMLEQGQTPPSPASDNQRTEQLNVRLTAVEKLFLEEAARSRGFRGVSDFVRSASLASARAASTGRD